MRSRDTIAEQPTGNSFQVVMRAHSRLVIDPGNVIAVNALASTGNVQLRIYTSHVQEGHAVPVPRELIIEATGGAESVEQAVAVFHGLARPFTDILAFCANAHVGLLEPHLAWDATDGRSEREFMEVYLRDERGLPLPGRRLKLPETQAILSFMSELSDAEAGSLVGVLSRYGVALSHWHLGGETAAFTYLWFAVEALAKLMVSSELRSGKTAERIADEYGMPRTGGVRLSNLEAFVRKNAIFRDDTRVHDDAFEVSNGLEHASEALADLHPRTSELAPEVFLVLRRAILRFLDPEMVATKALLEGLSALPLDTIQRRIVRGEFVNVGDHLAHPDLLYPVLEWRPRVESLTRADNGDYRASFSDKMTVRCAPGVEFRARSFEFRGRPDGSTGPPPTQVSMRDDATSTEPNISQRVIAFLTQAQDAVASLGPGESGAAYSPPDAHLLEIFNMMRSTFKGCVVLATQSLPHEALMLGRSVFRDAMRLHEASSSDAQNRAALAFGWRLDSLDALERLLNGSADHAIALTERKSQISRAAERFTDRIPLSFRPATAVAEAFGDDDYGKIDQMVQAFEGRWDVLSYSRRSKSDEAVVELHDAAVNEWAYPLVAKYVGGSYLLGAQAALTIFGWEDVDSAIAMALDELERLESTLADASDSDD